MTAQWSPGTVLLLDELSYGWPEYSYHDHTVLPTNWLYAEPFTFAGTLNSVWFRRGLAPQEVALLDSASKGRKSVCKVGPNSFSVMAKLLFAAKTDVMLGLK